MAKKTRSSKPPKVTDEVKDVGEGVIELLPPTKEDPKKKTFKKKESKKKKKKKEKIEVSRVSGNDKTKLVKSLGQFLIAHNVAGSLAEVSISGGGGAAVKGVIPSGLEVLDKVLLRVGGWPSKRIVELFGGEGAGKTALAILAMAQCQKHGGVAALIDTENAFDPSWCAFHGVDLDSLIYANPQTIEDTGMVLEGLLRTLDPASGPHLVVWDSLVANSPQAELDGTIGDARPGLRARLFNEICRKITTLATRANACVIIINQIRDKVGVLYGSTETTPGGRALKHHASIRLRVHAPKMIDTDGAVVAMETKISIKKSRFRPPGELLVKLDFRTGWDDVWSTFRWAKDSKVVPAGTALSKANFEAARKALGWE